jgi:hypothetical protein
MASCVVGNLYTVPSALLFAGLRVVCDSNDPATDRASAVRSSVYAVEDPFFQAVCVERVEAEHVSRHCVRR